MRYMWWLTHCERTCVWKKCIEVLVHMFEIPCGTVCQPFFLSFLKWRQYWLCDIVCVCVDAAVQDVRTPIKPRTDGSPAPQIQTSPAAAVGAQYFPQGHFMYQNPQWTASGIPAGTMTAAPAPPPQPSQQPQAAPLPVIQQASVVQMLEQPASTVPMQPASAPVAPPRLISLPVLLQAERAWPSEQAVKMENAGNAGNFDDVIKSVKDQLYFAIEWAKMVPPFTELPIEDQVQL